VHTNYIFWKLVLIPNFGLSSPFSIFLSLFLYYYYYYFIFPFLGLSLSESVIAEFSGGVSVVEWISGWDRRGRLAFGL